MTRNSFRNILFVVGAPGVGKTTAIRNILGPLDAYTLTQPPTPKWTIDPDGAIAAVGHYTGATFDGGDTVSYTGARACLDYMRDHVLPNTRDIVLDGDRFSTAPALAYVRALPNVRVACAHLVASDDALAARRAERGSNQNPTWIKGRVTKARNFAALAGGIDVPADAHPEAVADLLVRVLLGFAGAAQGMGMPLGQFPLVTK